MRLSFAGGGTDLPSYYEPFGGMVVSTAIDKYVYVIITPNGQGSLQVSSSDYSTFIRHSGGDEVAEDGKLRYARVFLREFGVRSGCSVFIASEMPPGSGLGSSSSLAVALTKALATLDDLTLAKEDVAARAAEIELTKLQMPIGMQDHYASAFGGLNAIHFSADGTKVEPLDVSDSTRSWLEASVLIFFTEQAHHSGDILAEQTRRSRDDPEALAALHAIKAHAGEAKRAILEDRPQDLGPIMHESWTAKKRLAGQISNSFIDGAYAAALEAGATGGKIAGAGGGGFLMLICPVETQGEVTDALSDRGLVRSDFHLDSVGARVLVNNAAA